MTSITAEIEKAQKRVKNKSSVYADMVKLANSYINPEATLNLGEPTAPEIPEPEIPKAIVSPPEPIAPPPETILPNQSKNVTITEFEIHPEKPSARAKNPRRNNFGFTLNPIISVSRPKR